MSALLKKIHFNQTMPFVVLYLPSELQEEFDFATGYQPRIESLSEPVSFVLVFIQNQTQLHDLIPHVISNLKEDAMFWIAYPKKTSKKYKTDLTRDHGWDVLGEYGYEHVSLVSLNDDFSIFRLRNVKYIKTMIRSDDMKLTNKAK
jgi:hypothetical protein